MKARLYGFEWTQAAISIDDFFEYLKTQEGNERFYLFSHRLVYVGEKAGYFVGLLLSAKHEKRFCELETFGTSFKVLVRQLEGDNRFVDFNFFIVNKLTGRGLYQHYYHSASLPTFHDFLKRLYNEKRDLEKEAALKAHSDSGGKSAGERAIRSKYHQTIGMTPLFKKEAFEELIRTMKEISRIQFDVGSFDFVETWFTRATGRMKKRRESISFTPGPAGPLVEGIVAMINDESTGGDSDQPVISQLSVTGVDANSEEEMTYKLSKNIKTFAEYEFSDIANEKTLDVDNLVDSPLVTLMLEVADENKVFFETRAD